MTERPTDEQVAELLCSYQADRPYPGGMHFQYRAAAEDRFDCCAECNRVSSSYVPWPCATYKAVTEHEGGTSA